LLVTLTNNTTNQLQTLLATNNGQFDTSYRLPCEHRVWLGTVHSRTGCYRRALPGHRMHAELPSEMDTMF